MRNQMNLPHNRKTPLLSALSLASLLVAGHASSQEVIDAQQAQGSNLGGDVVATQKLNVEANDGLVEAGTTAQANSLNAGTQGLDAKVKLRQSMQAKTIAVTTVNGTNSDKFDAPLGTPVYLDSHAGGNAAAMTVNAAKAQLDIKQTYSGPQVYAETGINSPNNSIYEGGQGYATATANQTMLGGRDGIVSGSVTQSSNAYTQSRVAATVAYSPSPSYYEASATQNYLSFNGKGASGLELGSRQLNTHTTEANVSLNGGNLWHPQVSSNAAANVVELGNHGGALVSYNNQSNQAQVLSNALVKAGQWSDAYVSAKATGNDVYAGNEDIYVKLDNSQFTEGGQGIEASASFTGHAGYDATLSAEATGNSATAFACAECRADFNANSSQTNNSDVTATTNATITGSGRSIISNARATGNSATFYVSSKK